MSESTLDINCWAITAAVIVGLGAIVWQIFRSEKGLRAADGVKNKMDQ